MSTVKEFTALTKDEKIKFFIQCQKILLDHHSKNEFVFRRNNFKERLFYVKELCNKYQGLCYSNDNVCILFNRVFVADGDVTGALQAHKYKPPVEHYNAIAIDFVVFRKLNDCLDWALTQYNARTQFVMYVKKGNPQLHKSEAVMKKIFKIKVAA